MKRLEMDMDFTVLEKEMKEFYVANSMGCVDWYK